MWFIWPWALLPKKKISKKFDIGLLLNQNCLGSLTKIIFSPSAVSMKIRLLHPVEQDYLDLLYLLVSFKEHCSSIPVSISAVYRCLECLPFWCYFRRSAFHTKSYSKDPKIVPAKKVRFSVISHHKRVKLQDLQMSKTGRGAALADVLPLVIAVPVVMSDCVPVGEGVEVRVGLPNSNQS